MKRATGFAAVLMAAAMVFTMACCGSSKDADTSAKKETKTEDSKDKENSDKQFIVGFDAEYPYRPVTGGYPSILLPYLPYGLWPYGRLCRDGI